MENEKQNDDSKSSGMELLENVINSNERNIASNDKNMESNAELKENIENFLFMMGEAQQDLVVVNQSCKDIFGLYEKEQLARDQFLAIIPNKIEMILGKETRDYLENFKNKSKKSENFIWGGIGIMILGILILIISVNFATNWYKASIKAKSELRQEILNEIADEGKKFYNENEIKLLQENTEVMKLWIKNNPKKAEDFLRFKDGFEARKSE
ncbi:hypothetical protein [Chryseobacterium gambrini]|uniref:hypothetical protein n=1 Tax=Chryseobacterium gambrini TaxID=373672 RepID=UPI0025B4ECA8|nr:hypothetical protein [Chryseobacterium gambrini]MDN4028710.1 hypothetical protein [Chryseobacterium gambrini]